MKTKECPKCERQELEGVWHSSKGPCDLANRKVGSVNKSDKEHLHYYCKCGYDFVLHIGKDNG